MTFNRGNKFVAVVVDMYTKWPKAYTLPNQEAETAAQAVMDNFICRLGCPPGVLSDKGQVELRLPIDAMREEPPSEQSPDYP